MLKFYWNGIKDNGSKLQRCHYSDAQLINFPAGVITIYKRDYDSFSDAVWDAFEVVNNSDIQTDYMEKDRIRVMPDHPLYADAAAALAAQKAHNVKRAAKRAA